MKKFILISIIANILGILGWYTLAYSLDKEEFGLYGIIINTLTMLLPILTLMRERIIATSKSSFETMIEYNEYIKTLFFSVLICIPIIYTIFKKQNIGNEYLILTIILLISNSIINLIKAEYTSKRMYKNISYINIMQQTVLLIFAILSLYGVISVTEVLLSQLIIFTPVIIKRLLKIKIIKERSRYTKQLLTIVTPSSLSESFTSNTIFLIATWKFNISEIASFILITRLVMFPLSNISRILQPIVTKEFSEEINLKKIKNYLIILFLFCFFYGALQINIIEILINFLGKSWDENNNSNNLIIILLCLQFFVSVYSQLLIAKRKLINHSLIQVVNVIMSIPLFFVEYENIEQLLIVFLCKELIFRFFYFSVITKVIFYDR